MKFRPCIDIHNGKVKQIVGGKSAGMKEIRQIRILLQNWMRHGMPGSIRRTD